MGLIERTDVVQTIKVHTVVSGDTESVDPSTSIDLRNASGAIVLFASDPGSSVQFWVSDVSDDDSTFYRLKAKDGTTNLDLGDVGDNVAVPLPDEAFAAHYVRLVGTVKVTATVMLKG